MEMVAMGLVGLGAKHGTEHAASALVQPAQEPRLCALSDVLMPRCSGCGAFLFGAHIGPAGTGPLQLRRLNRTWSLLVPRGVRVDAGNGADLGVALTGLKRLGIPVSL